MDTFIDAFSWMQQSLFEALVQHLVFALGLAHLLDKAYEGTGWLVVGLLQIGVLLTVLGPMQRRLGGCNYGVLLPWWDMLFGTADFTLRYDPTGIRDQIEKGRDYGQGFWAQQWLGVMRLFGRA